MVEFDLICLMLVLIFIDLNQYLENQGVATKTLTNQR